MDDILTGLHGMANIVNTHVGCLTDQDTDGDEPSVWDEVNSRRCGIANASQVMGVMDNIAACVQLQRELKQSHKSGLRIHSIDQEAVMYTRIQSHSRRIVY